MPLIFMPKQAFALGMPPGFEDFEQVYFEQSAASINIIDIMVNLNKNCILAVLEQLHAVGIFN